jgi:hypothetical protein
MVEIGINTVSVMTPCAIGRSPPFDCRELEEVCPADFVPPCLDAKPPASSNTSPARRALTTSHSPAERDMIT